MVFSTINPTNGEIIAEYHAINTAGADTLINASAMAFESWRKTSFSHRAEVLKKTARILRNETQKLAGLMALEMGKPLAQGVAEAEKCAWVCEYYADNAETFLTNENIKTEYTSSFVTFQPIGTVFAIMPWNFPLWQVFRFAAPALMAGNTGILKHARNTMGCAIEIERIFLEAGLPEGVFTNLVTGSDIVPFVINHKNIKAVTLTGSSPVGSEVASLAGRNLKKTVLELGGSDPYIIFPDADIDYATTVCTNARLINSGQSCIAAKRFIVSKDVIDEFTELFVKKMSEKRAGDPFEASSDLGPQARFDLRDELHSQVKASIDEGASLLTGGEMPEGKGYFYPPTVLGNVTPGMPAYHEELFGPVASVISAEDEADAVRIANDSSFGLGSAIFTADTEKAIQLASHEIQAGCCFINDSVKSDPRLPFGGINGSGYGRELSLWGIREFVNIKTVCLK